MHARHASSNFPVQRTRALSGAGDEEAFETKASPPAVAGPLISAPGPSHHRQGVAAPAHGSPGNPLGHPAPARQGQPGTAASAAGNPDGILLDLMTGAETLHDSLELLAAASARAVVRTADVVIECAVVVRQPKRTPAITGTTPDVIRLLEWEQHEGEGPVSEVLSGGHLVAVLQRSGDFRSPRYCNQLQLARLGSVLGVRLAVDQGA